MLLTTQGDTVYPIDLTNPFSRKWIVFNECIDGINKMAYFVVNHSAKQIYRMTNWRQTFDEVMDDNPSWGMKDDVECYDDDTDAIEGLLRLDYVSNLNVYELPQYISDPEFLVWYMDSHGSSLYDITRAIKSWDGTDKFHKANSAIEDMLAWKHEQEYMSGEKDATGYADEDEMMLCETMNKVM